MEFQMIFRVSNKPIFNPFKKYRQWRGVKVQYLFLGVIPLISNSASEWKWWITRENPEDR